jgi:hypothetical protein
MHPGCSSNDRGGVQGRGEGVHLWRGRSRNGAREIGWQGRGAPAVDGDGSDGGSTAAGERQIDSGGGEATAMATDRGRRWRIDVQWRAMD